MRKPTNILLQTTITPTGDDWAVRRFSLLTDYLASIAGEDGEPLYRVTARDREPGGAGDPVLGALDESEYDELWLFAVDTGDGLTEADCRGISAFCRRGGGLLTARDHQDLGSSLCTLAGVGGAHFFHTRNPEPDESRRARDDEATASISWPNYHSGRNGDYQRVTPVGPTHELLRDPADPSRVLELFPAHPHEGAVGVPEGESRARVIATGKSLVSGRPFNLAVVFERAHDERGNVLGRAVAESSFHHFVDYNWDVRAGCPSFVEEAPGDEISRNPQGLRDIKAYVSNLARWLAP
jgi:hypothetical protein